MDIIKNNCQMILRPSKGNGFDFRIETFGGFEFGVKVGVFECYPFCDIWLPAFHLGFERFNSDKYNRLDSFFHIDEENRRNRRGTMRKIEIIVEHLPFRELSPNSRVHFRVKARAVKAQREEVGWLAKAQWGNQKPMSFARISYQFIVKDKRRHDIDNCVSATKSMLDGLVDAGVLLDDDAKHLSTGQSTIRQGNVEQTIIKVVEEILK